MIMQIVILSSLVSLWGGTQEFVSPAELSGLKDSLRSSEERGTGLLEDRRLAEQLTQHLITYGKQSPVGGDQVVFSSQFEESESGRRQSYSVNLIARPESLRRLGPLSSSIMDPTHRFSYSQLSGYQRIISHSRDGKSVQEEWAFEVSFEGRILAARYTLQENSGPFTTFETGESKDLNPNDPQVAARWRRIAGLAVRTRI